MATTNLILSPGSTTGEHLYEITSRTLEGVGKVKDLEENVAFERLLKSGVLTDDRRAFIQAEVDRALASRAWRVIKDAAIWGGATAAASFALAVLAFYPESTTLLMLAMGGLKYGWLVATALGAVRGAVRDLV